ncbi:MAG: LytR C-terminal domain-containing protein [Gaiellaceae bacterium]
MDHAQTLAEPFPWRTATLVASAVAALELLVLVAGAALLLVHPFRHHPALASTARTPVQATHHAAAAARPVAPPPQPLRPRSLVHVLVLNGNGVQGAAAVEASRLQGLGYRIAGSTNAPRHDYARSLVMYAPGYAREARRLAREASIPLVSPVDGVRPSGLKGARLVVILGN